MTHSSIVLSAASEPLLEAASDWLEKRKEEYAEVLLLAPTSGAADDLVRRAASRRGGFIGLHRLTLSQLAVEAAAAGLASRNLSPITRLGIHALLSRAVYYCLQSHELDYFLPVADTPGFIMALASTLDEIRMEGLSGSSLEGIGPVGRDLARLVKAYEQNLTGSLLADRAEVFRIACGELEKTRYARLPVILLNLPPHSRREEDFLSVLAGQSPAVLATNLVGDDEGTALLEKCLGVKAVSPEISWPSPSSGGTSRVDSGREALITRLERLRRCLFASEGDESIPGSQESESLDFFSAPGEGRECVEIARRIRFTAGSGVRFDRMAVGLRNPDIYNPLIEDALRRADIPVHFSGGTIRPDSSGRAFLALLDCAVEGLSATRFAEYLSLGQVPMPDASGAPPVDRVNWVEPRDGQLSFKTLLVEESGAGESAEEDYDGPVLSGVLQTPAQWEQLLVDAAVIGGKERWFRRIRGLENEVRIQLRRPEDFDEATRRRLQNRLRNLVHLENFALPLIGFLDELREPARWARWLDSLRTLASMSLRRPESVLSVLLELSPMGDVGPVTLPEVRNVLADRLSFLRSEPAGDRYGKVLVLTLEELSARSFDHVFLPGLAEGIFPRKPGEDPLLLDVERSRLGIRSTLERRRLRERLLLRTAIAAPVQRLVVSYPRVDVAQNRSRVPSFYALDVFRAAEGVLPDVREIEKRADASAPARLGWPAPADYRHAVDDAEFDLAWLEPFLHRPPSATTGKGRFLLLVNPRLARSLRARARRWRNSFSEADGLVSPDGRTRELLQQERLRARSYSPTALQQFAACPYRFFLYSILRLRSREESVSIEQLDPLTRGALFHEVQFRLLNRLKTVRKLPVTERNLPQVSDHADSVLDEVAGEYGEELAPAIPRVWTSEIEGLRTDLRGWLREVAHRDREWVPVHFEYAFGMAAGEERDQESTSREATIFGGMRIRGSIDLIEKSEAGRTLRVTDHKTGKPPDASLLVIRGGEVLQPMLYGLAAEQLFQENVEKGRLFFCTQRGDYREVTVKIDSGTCEKLKAALEIIDRSIEQGFLPAAPSEKACSYCDYRLVCGPYEEYRIGRKVPTLLKDLKTLRSFP